MSNINPLVELSDALANAAETAGKATVLVSARRRFPASGIAYNPSLVLTADHVVERDDDISIELPDGTEQNASLAGRDPGSDLALLRLNRPELSPVEIAPGDARVGQMVLSIGRPTEEGIQASLGVISAIGGAIRTGRGGLLERYLRTDAIPYPGFSGGPLVDIAGRALGVNTSGLARGASLSIPIALAWQVAEALKEHGSVRRGYLGVRSQPVTISAAQQNTLGRQQASGLLLVSVEADSPAEAGGLLVGDIIIALEGKPVTDPDELLARLLGDTVGKSSQVDILRGGQPVSVMVTIGERK
jgi:S1-C subfamily serine protease